MNIPLNLAVPLSPLWLGRYGGGCCTCASSVYLSTELFLLSRSDLLREKKKSDFGCVKTRMGAIFSNIVSDNLLAVLSSWNLGAPLHALVLTPFFLVQGFADGSVFGHAAGKPTPKPLGIGWSLSGSQKLS